MNGFSFLLAIISILFTSVGQLLLKIGANLKDANNWIPQSLKPYINRYTISGYGILFAVTILSIYILEYIPLKFFFPLFISGNLIVITVLAQLFLQESFTKSDIMGICLIIAGVLIFSL
jgi:multidrug transporter EmrE-like cation transporter